MMEPTRTSYRCSDIVIHHLMVIPHSYPIHTCTLSKLKFGNKYNIYLQRLIFLTAESAKQMYNLEAKQLQSRKKCHRSIYKQQLQMQIKLQYVQLGIGSLQHQLYLLKPYMFWM